VSSGCFSVSVQLNLSWSGAGPPAGNVAATTVISCQELPLQATAPDNVIVQQQGGAVRGIFATWKGGKA
jgi:hypothetical protein